MLKTIRILNLAVIQEAQIEFGPGLNLLTGETGTGKSILVDSLGLIRGDRADTGLVRAGSDRAMVEATFEIPPEHPSLAVLEERGIPFSAEDPSSLLIVRREIRAGGGGRAFLNDSACTVETIREVTARLIDMHRQHDQRSLLAGDYHRTILDRFGGHGGLVEETRLAFRAVEAALKRQEELRELEAGKVARASELGACIEEIDRVAPAVDEAEALSRRRTLLRNAGTLQALLQDLDRFLDGGDEGAIRQAIRAESCLAELAGMDPGLVSPAAQLERARIDLEDVAAALREYGASAFEEGAEDPEAELENLESRLAALERLRLRYGKTEEEVLARRARAAEELDALADLDAEFDRADRERKEALDRYRATASRLSRARKKAAGRLGPRIQEGLAGLAMERARFEIRFRPAVGEEIACTDGTRSVLSAAGAERVEFLLGANPGEPAVPLAKAASGGELSRLMLALHGVLNRSGGDHPSLVFDEIDAGIGGQAADRIGARLRELSEGNQVLCVTHLPQVAAYADRHYRVEKQVAGRRTHVVVEPLDPERRIAEMARMMGGRVVTPATLKGAAEMIEAAVGATAGRESE